MQRLNALRGLLHDAVDAVTTLVEDTHLHTARKPHALLEQITPLEPGVRAMGSVHEGIARLTYASVRLGNRAVEKLGDAVAEAVDRAGVAQGLERLAPLDEAQARELAVWVDTTQSGLNAWIGDFLCRRENGLALTMGFRRREKPVALTREALTEACPDATGKLCIFVHGLGCTDATWRFHAREQFGDEDAHYGSFLMRDLGFTPLYLRYNTGRRISHNARELAQMMEALLEAYPVPVTQIALVGHSMGGLVSRGAAHHGQQQGLAWIKRLSHVLCIGAPNLGAPLEKATNLLASALAYFDTAGTQVPAKILNLRSVGIKDLRFGYVVDQDWSGYDPDAFLRDTRTDLPLVDGVSYGYIAATFLRDPDHPLGHLLGDLLVRVPSACGKAPEPTRHIPFHIGKVVHGVHHIAMLNHPDVYEQVLQFLSGHWRQDPRRLSASA